MSVAPRIPVVRLVRLRAGATLRLALEGTPGGAQVVRVGLLVSRRGFANATPTFTLELAEVEAVGRALVEFGATLGAEPTGRDRPGQRGRWP